MRDEPKDQPDDLRPAGPIGAEGLDEADEERSEPDTPSDDELAEEGSLLAERAQEGRDRPGG